MTTKIKNQATRLEQANKAFQLREFSTALQLYKLAIEQSPALSNSIEFNISLCVQELSKQGLAQSNPRINQSIKTEIPVNPSNINKAVARRSKEPVTDLYLPLDCTVQDPQRLLELAVIINATNLDHDIVKMALEKIEGWQFSPRIFIIGELHSISKLALGYPDAKITVVGTQSSSWPLANLQHFLSEQKTVGYDLICLIQGIIPNESHGSPEDVKGFIELQTSELLNPGTISKITGCFANHESIGYVGSADAFKSIKILDASTQSSIAKSASILKYIEDPTYAFGFLSGACFWVRPSILSKTLSATSHAMGNNDPHLKESSIEALISIGHLDHGSGIALLYPRNYENTDAVLVNSKFTKIPCGSTYPIGMSARSFANLNTDLELLKLDFSSRFYTKSYPYLSHLKMPFDYHFLRFGANEGFNPNSNFSTTWSWESKGRSYKNISHNPYVSYLLDDSDSKVCWPAQENHSEITKIIHNAAFFDETFYTTQNPDVARSKFNPINHYVKHGCYEGRLPCRASSFDVLWYEANVLNEWSTKVNPLLHYALIGSKQSAILKPKLKKMDKSFRLRSIEKARRICLFAGYDSHGIVDDYVVELISALNKHADVFYLADCKMNEGELDKLNHITVKAWAFRHGEYDFGSYSRLALKLVGWEKLEEYDEVLLVNDSGYLLTSLDSVFEKMSKKKCDWWGLQATKGIAATRWAPSNQFEHKVPMDYVLERLLPTFEADDCYDFLIGSYFLAFRKPALSNPGPLHSVLSSVQRETNKRNIVLKYEVGLTRKMLLNGHRPGTFIDHLYPFHPIFTENHFKIIAEGFPLFKRYFLTENHYQTPQLHDWQDRIKSILPSVDLTAAAKNLYRISDADKLYRTLNIPVDGGIWPQPLLTDEEFRQEDLITPKDRRSWVFPVCAFDHSFSGNERMVYESIKANKDIRKVILTRSKTIDVDGENTILVPLKSREGQKYLIESLYIFIKHTPWRNTIYPLNPNLHRFINLWHGIPLKRIGYTSLDMVGKLDASAREHDKCHAVIASSKIDRLAMAAAFYPLTYHDVWLTGLPRNDVILRDENLLPIDFQRQLEMLRRALNGRRLVMYAPTFRNGQESSIYQFTKTDTDLLAACLVKHNAVLGIREHMAAKQASYWLTLKNTDIPLLDLGRSNYADIELLYREASALITDYSSCFIDFMLTEKPQICFAYDYAAYAGSERGLFYELNEVFPGPVCSSAESLMTALDDTLSGKLLESNESYLSKQKIFFDYIDDRNSLRVIEMIENEIYSGKPGRTRTLLEQ